MAKTNPAEDEALRRRVLAEMEGEMTNKERVERDDWLLLLFSKQHSKESEVAAHNYNVNLFNSLLSYARKVKELSSMRPRYFVNQENGDLIVEVEARRFGLIPVEMRSGSQMEANTVIDELEIDSDTDIDLTDQGYDELDEDDWFLLSFQNIGRINHITASLTLELDELERTYDEVIQFEERSGLRLIFYVLGDPDDEDKGLSFAVEKKEAMGF